MPKANDEHFFCLTKSSFIACSASALSIPNFKNENVYVNEKQVFPLIWSRAFEENTKKGTCVFRVSRYEASIAQTVPTGRWWC